jgi:FkbM family methyltransferase
MEESNITQIDKEVLITRKLNFYVREEAGYDPTVTDRIVIREMFDENVYQVFSKDVYNGTVLDIGANIGAFSVFASILGAKHVIAYEPEDENGQMFKQNIEVNNLTNISLRPNAVSNKDEEFEIYKAQGATKRTEYAGEIDVPKQKVKAIDINKILDELDEVAVLKIDCEGAEWDILSAISPDNMKKLVYITGEFHKTTPEIYGALMSKLSLTHNTHAFGHFDQGGQIYAKRY